MILGRRCGADGRGAVRIFSGISTFVRDDGGYTTITVAVALLVSLALVFSTASVVWTSERSADVQTVADSAAMSGANVVAAYSTIAQVLDACVLSMGILGTSILGAGMVLAAIPVVQGMAPEVIDAGRQILSARRDFAKSAAEGLKRLEKAIPALVAANAASCASANSSEGVNYVGFAIPLPMESESEFFQIDEVDDEELGERAEELRQASAKKEGNDRRARDAKEKAWRADTIDSPLCMRSRAEKLAGLSTVQNPHYPSVDEWHFEYARVRAQNYYLRRWQTEPAAGSSAKELQRSCARKVFYRYAYEHISSARCIEGESVSIDLPDLPHTAKMVRESSLYVDSTWPCTVEGGVRTLHCSPTCPGARGREAGSASLSDIESGAVKRCDECGMDTVAMGNVANASTNINNGFEHYWRIVVEASREYERACEDGRDAEREMKEKADEGESAFERAMALLAVRRPRLRPPGAYGCVAIVRRAETNVPEGLVGSFVKGDTRLPAGMAISAATLAPDEGTDGHNVLSSVFEGLGRDDRPIVISFLGNITQLWGRLLVAYGSGHESVSSSVRELLGRIDGVAGSQFASGLGRRLGSIVEAVGFEPADMRLRKPVLVNSQTVLDKAGLWRGSEVRELVASLPADSQGQAMIGIEQVRQRFGGKELTIAELPVPGTTIRIPLTVRLEDLMGVG